MKNDIKDGKSASWWHRKLHNMIIWTFGQRQRALREKISIQIIVGDKQEVDL